MSRTVTVATPGTIPLVVDALRDEAAPPPLAPVRPAAPSPVAPAAAAPADTGGSSHGMRTAGLVTGGLGLAGVGLGVALGLVAKSHYGTAFAANHCANEGGRLLCDSVDGIDRARTLGLGGAIAFAAGAAALATGVLLVVAAPSARPSNAAPRPSRGSEGRLHRASGESAVVPRATIESRGATLLLRVMF